MSWRHVGLGVGAAGGEVDDVVGLVGAAMVADVTDAAVLGDDAEPAGLLGGTGSIHLLTAKTGGIVAPGTSAGFFEVTAEFLVFWMHRMDDDYEVNKDAGMCPQLTMLPSEYVALAARPADPTAHEKLRPHTPKH